MNQRQTSDSDHDSSRVATEQRQSTDGPATHQRRISYPDPSRQTSDRRDGRATPNPSRQTSGRPATGQRQDSDRTATGQRQDSNTDSSRPTMDQRQTSRATADEQSNDGPVTGKQRTSRQERSKHRHIRQLHSRSLLSTHHRHRASTTQSAPSRIHAMSNQYTFAQ